MTEQAIFVQSHNHSITQSFSSPIVVNFIRFWTNSVILSIEEVVYCKVDKILFKILKLFTFKSVLLPS